MDILVAKELGLAFHIGTSFVVDTVYTVNRDWVLGHQLHLGCLEELCVSFAQLLVLSSFSEKPSEENGGCYMCLFVQTVNITSLTHDLTD